MTESRVTVTDNSDESRFEVVVDGVLAGYAEYDAGEPGIVAILHTEVLERFEGQGLAGRLAKAALSAVRASGRKVVPLCPYVRAYVRKHAPEYDDLLRKPLAP
ncbi:GNAT family N-acetyltransferase [Promicromonospora citrea]|uniref:N-acetyltransferase domain-containing protein n=1 Tax=Promicromonospora citrea TaxID=43677 RepID=A0A8H9L4U2_9MICO|nr:GNAT family N-acetyltransferase [Promicromonospora citrea]NNH50819.1 N-acetyltransferase [Promicromonospora citrea]GGM35742.1 hypothetical protein GCM10010102_33880 [Promicromonospora citrea]